MIESPRAKAIRKAVVEALRARFGENYPERLASLDMVADEVRLKALFPLAVTCPSLDAFLAALNQPGN